MLCFQIKKKKFFPILFGGAYRKKFPPNLPWGAKGNVQTASKDLLCMKSSHLGNTIRFRSLTSLFELPLPKHCSPIISPANMLWEIWKFQKPLKFAFKMQKIISKTWNVGKTFTSSKENVWLQWIQPHPMHLWSSE